MNPVRHWLWPLLLVLPAAAGATTLEEAWQGVVAHSPDYASLVARREAGESSAAAARALWMPTLAAQGGLARRSVASDTTGAAFSAPGFGDSTGVDFRTSVNGGTATQWALVGQQPLFDAARSADAAALRARARLAAQQFRIGEQALMLRTAQALSDVVTAQASLQAVRRHRAAADRARDMARARFEAGDIAVTDLRDAEAQGDLLRVRELDAQQALALANAAFSDLTGLPPPAGEQGEGSMAPLATAAASAGTLPAIEGSLEDWQSRALRSSPQWLAQQEQQALAAAEARRWSRIDGAQLSIVGQLGREALHGTGDYGSSGMTSRLATIGLQATLPLFTGGMRSAQRHGAEATLRAAGADTESVRLQVATATRAAWLEANTARARADALQRVRASAALRLAATRLGQETGERTLLELLAAEGAALQGDAEAVQAGCQNLIAGLRLRAAAGELDAQAMAAGGTANAACTVAGMH
jgi:outer membrane protein